MEPEFSDDERPAPEPEVDEWWVQQQANAEAAGPGKAFTAISDIWRFRPRFRLTNILRYRAPLLKVLRRRRETRAARLREQAAKPKQSPDIKRKSSSPTPSLAASETSANDDANSTDLEQELGGGKITIDKLVRGYLGKSGEKEIEELVRKYTGPMKIADDDTKALLRSYVIACQRMKVPILRAVVKSIAHGTTIVDIRHYSTSCESLQPLVDVLEKTEKITTLIIEDCGLGLDSQGGALVASIIKKDKHLKNLNLGSNFLGPRVVQEIVGALVHNRSLEYINLSRNQFADVDCARLVEVIGSINSVNAFDISGNEIGPETALVLTDWLLQPDCKLKLLNIGWSTIRRSIASTVCSSLRINVSLRMIDLSCNGLGDEGALALGEALRSNQRIKSLDVSGNRFRNEAAKMLAEGLGRNVGLQSLCLKDNPINTEGLLAIMTSIQKNRRSGLRMLDFTGIPVTPKIVAIAEAVKARLQNHPMEKAKMQQQQIWDFEFAHGPIISLEGHSFFDVPQKGLEFVVVHRFSDELQKHCPNSRLIDVFRSCTPKGDQGLTIDEFVRGMMKLLPMSEDELKHTAMALDPGSATTGFVNFNIFSMNFRIIRRNYFGDDSDSHRLRWLAKYRPLVSAIGEGVYLSTYNDPRLSPIRPNVHAMKVARLKGHIEKPDPNVAPVSKTLRYIERKELLTKSTWLLKPDKFEKIIAQGIANKQHPAIEGVRQHHRHKFTSKLAVKTQRQVRFSPVVNVL